MSVSVLHLLPNHWSHKVEKQYHINQGARQCRLKKTFDLNKNIFIIHIDECPGNATVNSALRRLVIRREILLIGCVRVGAL